MSDVSDDDIRRRYLADDKPTIAQVYRELGVSNARVTRAVKDVHRNPGVGGNHGGDKSRKSNAGPTILGGDGHGDRKPSPREAPTGSAGSIRKRTGKYRHTR